MVRFPSGSCGDELTVSRSPLFLTYLFVSLSLMYGYICTCLCFVCVCVCVYVCMYMLQATPQYQVSGAAGAGAGGGDTEQDKWLDDASENVKKQAFLMKRALDQGDVREALKFASLMTGPCPCPCLAASC